MSSALLRERGWKGRRVPTTFWTSSWILDGGFRQVGLAVEDKVRVVAVTVKVMIVVLKQVIVAPVVFRVVNRVRNVAIAVVVNVAVLEKFAVVIHAYLH